MIEGVKVKDLEPLPDDRGMLMEIWRSDDPDFQRFGQVYITWVNPGVVKAWHYHVKQTDHFVCVAGMAKVALYDAREGSPTFGETNDVIMGWQRQRLLIIPPGIYHGFTAVGTESAGIVNIPSEPYNHENPDEYRRPYDDPEIGYDWGVKSR
jgi:dTDP-4-dehydrorhamnose 3,5-epimerase